MKEIIITILFIGLLSCQEKSNLVNKRWINNKIDIKNLVEGVNTYHMLDSTGSKVGSMIFGMEFKEGRLIARDTSEFYNGNVYETAEFYFDTTDFTMQQVKIKLATPGASLDLDLNTDGRVEGSYSIKRDSTSHIYDIDSVYAYDLVRGELYMLLQTIKLNRGDTLDLTIFAPTSISVSNSQIYYHGRENINTPMGTFDCDVIWLKADKKMPSNKIWISREFPRKLVKFYVPSSQLTIELINSKQS